MILFISKINPKKFKMCNKVNKKKKVKINKLKKLSLKINKKLKFRICFTGDNNIPILMIMAICFSFSKILNFLTKWTK